MGQNTHEPGEETFIPRHSLPKKAAFLEASTGLSRAVSHANPLPVFQSSAGLSGGLVPGWSVVHKFGHHAAVGVNYVPVCFGGLYQTPQASGATALRVKAGGDANDDAAGTGAREITLQGLDETGAEVSVSLATNGASASLGTSVDFLRLFRAYVSESGTYASAVAGSHAATITIENAAGGTDWAIIPATGFPSAQSYIGAYTVPLGKEAYLSVVQASTDSSKVTDIIAFFRTGVLDAAPPYSAMRAQRDIHIGPRGFADIKNNAPEGPYAALTDIGFMAKVDSGTAEVDVNFEIWLKDTDQ